jgi:GR25 family glycosyltransferase involved in LPS biosynthesis
MANAKERLPLVNKIRKITGAKIFHALKLPDGVDGCRESHMKLYREAPPGPITVFEDDCEIVRPDLLKLINQHKDKNDIIYLGVNSVNKNGTSYGTHAMWISSKARAAFLKDAPSIIDIPLDKMWSKVIKNNNLQVYKPPKIHEYVRQKSGLRSYISGKVWKNYGHKVST